MPTVVYQVQPAKKQYDGNSGVSGTAYVSQNQSGGYSGVSARYNLGYTPSVNLHEPGPVWCRQWCIRYSLSYTLSVILIYTSLDLSGGDRTVLATPSTNHLSISPRPPGISVPAITSLEAARR